MPHMLVSLHDLTANSQHQAHGQICHIVAQYARRMGHHDAALHSSLRVDAVVAHAKHRNQFQIGQLLKQGPGHRGLSTGSNAYDSWRQFRKYRGIALVSTFMNLKYLFKGL